MIIWDDLGSECEECEGQPDLLSPRRHERGAHDVIRLIDEEPGEEASFLITGSSPGGWRGALPAPRRKSWPVARRVYMSLQSGINRLH